MELNNDWVNINLGKSALLKARIGWQGLTTAEYLNSGDYFLVTGTDFLNGYIDWKNCVYVEKERYDQDKYIQLQVDDILVTKDGTIGKVAIIDKIIKPTTLNSGVFVVRPIKNSFYPKYLFYILRSGHFSDFLSKLTAGSTINHLYQKDFVYYTFPAPPTIEEQKQIANTLSDTDQLIQNLKKLIAKKKAIKQGAMQELLTGKKRLKGFTEEWETKKVNDIGYVGRGRVISHKEISKSKSKKYPVYSSQTANNGIMGYIDTFDFEGEYISWTTDGENAGTVFYRNGKFNSTNVCGLIKVKNKYDSKFISYLLGVKTPFYVSKNLANPKLMNEPMKKIELHIPQFNEQQAIAQILSDMDTEIETLEQKLQKTQVLKQGMMQELLTGKIRLVKPATQEEPKPLAMVAEPEVFYKSNEGHNWEFNEAVIISAMVDKFGSEKYPLGRKRYTKLCYLMHRYKEEEVKGYLKKAAGPYNPATKYKGPEKIAQKNKYIKKKKAGKYAGFVVDECIIKAVAYFKKWYGENVLNWLEQFRFQSNDTLELWATVDMAIEDIKQENKPVNFQSIKELINNHEEWRPKLKRPVFSDENIKTAINKINQLFG